MTLPQDSSRLAELPVLLFDAQATAAHAARGTLLEIGWARSSTAAPADAADVEACLVAPPPGTGLPRAIARLTGVRRGEWERGATPAAAWARLLVAAAALGPSPVPLVVHFARFEEPFLRALHGRHGSGPLPFEPICTHAIARRLLPGLPRCTLRALAGYFGAAVSTLRRSADHVLATGLVWSQLVAMLQERGIGEPAALRAWLRSPAPRARRAARAYPLPAGLRHALPRGPGVYRFLRQGGAVLYVGKATSVRHRVNGHFHARDNERALEMLSQVRDVSCTPTASALEAALLEADEIKRLAPPYNRALAAADRSVWFATSELCDLREAPDDDHTVGPLSSRALFDSLEALRRALRTGRPVPLAARAIALGLDPAYAPAPRSFADGCARFAERHGRLATTRDVLRVGARLWTSRCERSTPAAESPGADGPPTEASRWDAKTVLEALEDTVLRCAHAVRRARWLVRLSEASLAWSEPGHPGLRLLTITRGAVTACDPAGDGGPPIPTGAHRDLAERRAAFDLPTFDRLRVLTTELRHSRPAPRATSRRTRAALRAPAPDGAPLGVTRPPLRILFVSDSHLGFDLPLRPRVERRRRGPDFFACFEQALEPALRGEADVVVHGGDLLYRSRVPVSLVQRALEPLLRVATRGVPVLLVPGNHERSAIPYPLLAAHEQLHVFRQPSTVVVERRGLRVAFAGFPHARDVRRCFPALLGATGYRSHDVDARVLCVHACIEGATCGPAPGHTFRDAHDVIAARDLPGDVAVVLSGHIHRHQLLRRDLLGRSLPAPVIYAGSVERTSFAERDETKGFVIARVTADGGGRLDGYDFQILPARPMQVTEVTGPSSRLEHEIREALAAAPPDVVLQLRVPDSLASHPALRADRLRLAGGPATNVSVVPRRSLFISSPRRASRPT